MGEFSNIIDRVRPFSMVPDDAIELTIREAIKAIDYGFVGDLAEFGTWLGGCSFAVLLAQRERYGRVVKPVWMFDSFEGLPLADGRDGPAAIKYQADVDSPTYFDNCTAPLDQVRQAQAHFGFDASEAVIVPGWFDETIPATIEVLRSKGVSLLRVDCDWYAPVKLVLQEITPVVAENATIILDDYFAWDGCARATHDYLSENDLPYRIRSLPSENGAWMIKQSSGRV